MCGGFALSLGAAARNGRARIVQQLAYTAGRVFTYSVAGALAGYSGWRLASALPAVTRVQALVSILAGGCLLLLGLRHAGVLRWPVWKASGGFCPAAAAFRGLLRSQAAGGAFLAGVATGFLPCGLVYSLLALAAASGSPADGALRMALFGCGTAPAMIAVGSLGPIVGWSVRRRAFRAAAWCIVAIGALAVARGGTQLRSPSDSPDGCLYCESDS
jgi:hypothetical protein